MGECTPIIKYYIVTIIALLDSLVVVLVSPLTTRKELSQVHHSD